MKNFDSYLYQDNCFLAHEIDAYNAKSTDLTHLIEDNDEAEFDHTSKPMLHLIEDANEEGMEDRANQYL